MLGVQLQALITQNGLKMPQRDPMFLYVISNSCS